MALRCVWCPLLLFFFAMPIGVASGRPCRQWSWPINLPVQFFGIFPAGVLADGGAGAPWAAEIDQKVLVSSVGIAPYVEVAFFHRRTRTLLVTDAVVSVPERPPPQVAAADLLSAAASNFFIRVLAGDMAEVRSRIKRGTLGRAEDAFGEGVERRGVVSSLWPAVSNGAHQMLPPSRRCPWTASPCAPRN